MRLLLPRIYALGSERLLAGPPVPQQPSPVGPFSSYPVAAAAQTWPIQSFKPCNSALCPFPRISTASFPLTCLPCPCPCPHRGRHQQLAGGREGGVCFSSSSRQFLTPECCQENRELPLSILLRGKKADFPSPPNALARPIPWVWLPRSLPLGDITLGCPPRLLRHWS